MPVYLDPRGKATFGIGICARCSRKMFLEELSPDPNSPGLMVCAEDKDVLDPYRLPARQTEQITLPFNRPDRPLTGHSGAIPVRDQLGLRIETLDGDTILSENEEYIDVVIAPGPLDLP